MSLLDALSTYPGQAKVLGYGTAGFRENVSLPLHSVFVKMGVLAALRSRAMGSRSVGLMVTASHNPECDNGVKLVDADGGMMTQAWEPYATELVNTPAAAHVVAALDRIAAAERVPADAASVVVVGRDTRPHSAELAKCIVLGAAAAGATVHDMGLVTTPQLHFIVQQTNARAAAFPVLSLDRAAALTHYYETIGAGYLALRDSTEPPHADSSSFSNSRSSSGGDQCVSETDVVVIDGSNGIGAVAVAELANVIDALRPGALRVDLRNGAYAGPVNDGCGAEHVQKGQVPPQGVSAVADQGQTLVSFDGDADRIVFHAFLPSPTGVPQWVLLDGDKIAALLSVLIARELKEAGLDADFSMGVVQTAYANGASTAFLQANAVPVVMAKTGVKYLHHKAQEFDVGVYFEANGHGTVLLSERFLACVDSANAAALTGKSAQEPRAALAIRRLAVRVVYRPPHPLNPSLIAAHVLI